jgi:hypothetical protein
MKTAAKIVASVAVLAATVPPGDAAAQRLVGNEVVASLVVDSVAVVGDSTVVLFRVVVDPTSPSDFSMVIVEAPEGLIDALAPPGEEANWFTTVKMQLLDRALWSSLDLLAPPEVSGPLRLFGPGYPGVVNRWIVGEVGILTMPTSDTVPTPEYPDLFEEASLSGKTIGAVAVPADTTPGALIDRLAGLATDACGSLGWISTSTGCTSISTDIADADAAEAVSDLTTADAELAAVLSTLDTALANGDTNTLGYWLLRSNIEIIRGKL